MDIGRFVCVDECTEDKAQLDFPRVLITTTQLEIVNTTSEFFIDGNKYILKMVEEWGCNLGEDAFLTEDDSETELEALTQFNNDPGLDEVQGEWELDELVDDLHEEWIKHDDTKKGKHITKLPNTVDNETICTRQRNSFVSTILEPILKSENIIPKNNQQVPNLPATVDNNLKGNNKLISTAPPVLETCVNADYVFRRTNNTYQRFLVLWTTM